MAVGKASARAHRAATLDLERDFTVLLTFAANRFNRIWSRYLLDRFELGLMEWRMLVLLVAEPGATVSRAAEVIDIDKGAISRALRRLEERALARADAPEQYPSRRAWQLTPTGRDLHDRVLVVARQRQQAMLAGLGAPERAALERSMTAVLDNLAAMESAS